jgi:hypothetical protein
MLLYVLFMISPRRSLPGSGSLEFLGKKRDEQAERAQFFSLPPLTFRLNVKKNEILLSLRGHKKKLLLRDNEPS